MAPKLVLLLLVAASTSSFTNALPGLGEFVQGVASSGIETVIKGTAQLQEFTGKLTGMGNCASTFKSNYQTLPALKKQELLWQRISENICPAENLQFKAPYDMIEQFKALIPTFMAKAFTWQSDEMITGRKKLIHPIGCAAKGKMIMFKNSTYTGLFKAGLVSPVIMRASVANARNETFIPGLAVKVLRDGKPSLNIFSVYSSDGQGEDMNFFAHPFTTNIPPPKSPRMVKLSKAFLLGLQMVASSRRPIHENDIPVYELAESGVTGKVKSPFSIAFLPNPKCGWASDEKTDFRAKLAKLPADATCWTISARREKKTEDEVVPDEIIGELKFESNCVASDWGDQCFYCQHTRTPWRAP